MSYRVHDTQVDSFTWAYISAAFWTLPEDEYPEYCYSGEFSISKDDADRLDGDTLIQMIEDCSKFQEENSILLDAVGDSSQNGHDFWLTRNGHGTGFWDRGYGKEGERLADAARKWGEFYFDLKSLPIACCLCGGEMELNTDTCKYICGAHKREQDICEGCYESLKNDSNYYLCETTEERADEFSSSPCERCGNKLTGERYTYGSVVRYSSTNNKVGLYFGECCTDCFEEINDA